MTQILRPDRLAELADDLATMIDRTPFDPSNLPGPMRVVFAMAKATGTDPMELIREYLTSSLRRLPSAAASDPDRADRVAAYLVHVAAYLTGQTDERPARIAL